MKEKIGTIKGIDLVKKSAPRANISFRTGKYMTTKDRPRDKSYKREFYDQEIVICASLKMKRKPLMSMYLGIGTQKKNSRRFNLVRR